MSTFVFFDVGGTLIRPEPSVGGVYQKAGQPFGLKATDTELQDAFRNAWKDHVGFGIPSPENLIDDEARTRARWRSLVEDVLDRINFHGDRDGCFNAFYDAFAQRESWQIFDDVEPVLKGLVERGIPKGIISNWDVRLPPLLDTLKLTQHFDPILVSALEGLEKPNPKIFLRGCEKVSTKPAEVIYVGDLFEFDIAPTEKLGMKAFLIDRKDQDKSPYAISSLLEILDYLDESS